MNIEVTGVEDHERTALLPWDASDVFVMIMVGLIILATWTYVYLHPSNEAFGIAVSATGVFITALHMVRVYDDKKPDA